MKATVSIFILALLSGCVSITRHGETERQLEECLTRLDLSSYHHIEAPRAAASMETTTTTLVLVVTAEQFLMNGEVLQGPDLSANLVTLRDEDPDIRILIRAEPDVPFGRVLEVMDMARTAGFSDYHLRAHIADAPRVAHKQYPRITEGE